MEAEHHLDCAIDEARYSSDSYQQSDALHASVPTQEPASALVVHPHSSALDQRTITELKIQSPTQRRSTKLPSAPISPVYTYRMLSPGVPLSPEVDFSFSPTPSVCSMSDMGTELRETPPSSPQERAPAPTQLSVKSVSPKEELSTVDNNKSAFGSFFRSGAVQGVIAFFKSMTKTEHTIDDNAAITGTARAKTASAGLVDNRTSSSLCHVPQQAKNPSSRTPLIHRADIGAAIMSVGGASPANQQYGRSTDEIVRTQGEVSAIRGKRKQTADESTPKKKAKHV